MTTRESRRRSRGTLEAFVDGETLGLLGLLVLVVALFALTTPGFLAEATFRSIAFQLPELGLLTLAMLIPILSGGLNLAITFTANMAALVAAWMLQAGGGPEAGVAAFLAAVAAALAVGAAAGGLTGLIIAYVGAHPILVTLSMMIFLRGLGEFLTRGGDVSGFPPVVAAIGHGSILGVPVPLILFVLCVITWNVLLRHTRLGFSIYMLGSNMRAVEYSGVDARRALTLVYVLSGVMSAIAGIVMLARFNSVRVGHGESYLLVTVLACFLGRVDPFGGFGRTVSVVLALVILQVIASGLNALGANQHLATALWGLFLILVMVVRSGWAAWAAPLASRRRAEAAATRPGIEGASGPGAGA
jgi:simple sugar transport system permease protein